ncbi:MAG: beta-1,3-glucanase family protein, partial [Nocardioidaceae bacterium]
VNGDQFVFDGGVTPFNRPTTKDVLFCDGALAAPNDGVTGPVAAVLGAALNRTTLLDSAEQPTTDPAGFYQAPATHAYSKAMHDNSVDGKAYGFPFDDVAGFASYIEDNATEMAVTLTPF